MKLYCKNCEKTTEVSKFTMKVVDNKVIKPESICDCGEQMKDVSEYKGLGGIIKRPGGKVGGKI
jgi:hypothetical protein